MRWKILKPFACAVEPHKVRTVEEGEILELGDDVDVEALQDAGFIEEHDGAAEVAIPDDWATIAKADRFALAAQISGGKVTSEKAAKAIIEAEMASRSAAAQ